MMMIVMDDDDDDDSGRNCTSNCRLIKIKAEHFSASYTLLYKQMSYVFVHLT